MLNRISESAKIFNEGFGLALTWAPLALILTQFALVLMTSLLGIGSIALQESLQYINALIFLGGAGYTAVKGGHVRVDLFYQHMSDRSKAWVDFLGTSCLLLPFLGLFWWASLPYVLDSWAEMEGSVESSGLPIVYLLKSTLLLFGLTLSVSAAGDLTRTIKILFSKE